MRTRLVAAVLALTLTGTGCAALPFRDSGDTYTLTAVFEQTVGLYETSDVLVMGVPVGSTRSIEVDGTTVVVEMSIDGDVPLPADLHATIGQVQLIGERNIVLYPPWDAEMAAAGIDKAADGDRIGLDRTVTPVEPDEGLQAFNDLASSLDADVVGGFLDDSARVLDGGGESLGRAIDQTARLTTTLTEVDEQLLDGADAIRTLAGSLADRDAQLGRLVDRFADASSVIAAERDGIAELLDAMVAMTEIGDGLLAAYGDTIPADIATAAALVSVFDANSSSIEQLLRGFPRISDGLARSEQDERGGLFLRTQLTPTVLAILDTLGILAGGTP